MSESPFFFGPRGAELFGFLHEPAVVARGGFVFCHPFAEEKLWAHRVYISLARELAARGYAVLRFDMRGQGDSDGEFSQATVAGYLDDVRCAVDELIARLPVGTPCGLLGLRLGGALAALVADADARINELVLWEPTVDGTKYAQEILLTNLATQMAAFGKVKTERTELVQQLESGATVNIDGYEMGRDMYRQIVAIDLARDVGRFRGRCLIVQIDRGPRPPRKDLQLLASRYPQAQLASCIEQPFWKEIKEFYGRAERLSATTLAWLEGASVPVSGAASSGASA